MISTNPILFGTFSTILLTVVVIGSIQENTYGAVKPFFPNTQHGLRCSEIFDRIQDFKSDKTVGRLSGDDQKALDNTVETYSVNCRPQYGGNPRVAGPVPIPYPINNTGETGIIGGQEGVINPGTSPNSTGEQIQKAQPMPGLEQTPPVKPEPVQPQPQQSLTPPDYRVKVQFYSITVHDDEDPVSFDDGEYTMRAVVNGWEVNLDKGSGGKLWDVGSGETVYFAPYTYAIVEIPRQFPISIYTVGYEADACRRIGYGEGVDSRIMTILKGPESEWLSDIRRIIDQDINGPHRAAWSSCHDSIGFINKIHTSYGAEVMYHMKSTDADDPDNPFAKPNFTLRYSIHASLIPK